MSAEAIRRLEERVLQLERELEAVKARLPVPEGNKLPWWKEQIGCFKDDEAHAEVMEIIRKNREKDYARANRRADALEAREKARAKNRKAKAKSRKVRG
jgi:hypothetical protein